MSTLFHLLNGKGKTAWLDQQMISQSEAAMEEGVKHSRFFILFLSGDTDENQGKRGGGQPEPAPEETATVDMEALVHGVSSHLSRVISAAGVISEGVSPPGGSRPGSHGSDDLNGWLGSISCTIFAQYF